MMASVVFLSRGVLEQAMPVADARRRRIFGPYEVCHMFYVRKDSRAASATDVRSFFTSAP